MTDKLKLNDVIVDYDHLRVSEILPLLPELYDDELEVVRDHESGEAARQQILDKITELLGSAPVPAPTHHTETPRECQEKLCQEPAELPGSYYCGVHEKTTSGVSDHGITQLLANILIEVRKMNTKLDDLAVQQEINRIRRDTHDHQSADVRPNPNAR